MTYLRRQTFKSIYAPFTLIRCILLPFTRGHLRGKAAGKITGVWRYVCKVVYSEGGSQSPQGGDGTMCQWLCTCDREQCWMGVGVLSIRLNQQWFCRRSPVRYCSSKGHLPDQAADIRDPLKLPTRDNEKALFWTRLVYVGWGILQAQWSKTLQPRVRTHCEPERAVISLTWM